MKDKTLKKIRELHEILLAENAKPNYRGRVLSLAITKLEECEMWYSREVPKVKEADEDLPLLKMAESKPSQHKLYEIEPQTAKELNEAYLTPFAKSVYELSVENMNEAVIKDAAMAFITKFGKEEFKQLLADLDCEKLSNIYAKDKKAQETFLLKIKTIFE